MSNTNQDDQEMDPLGDQLFNEAPAYHGQRRQNPVTDASYLSSADPDGARARAARARRLRWVTGQWQFAKANGWRVATKRVTLQMLAKDRRRGPRDYGKSLDHRESYRTLTGAAAAIVGHNYDGTALDRHGTENILSDARAAGLQVHIAPDKAMSWYYPGQTTLIVVTRPGVVVVWPTADWN